MVDPISADGRILRVNLRPYLAAKGDVFALVHAFVRTANEHKGVVEQLRRYWSIAEQMAEVGYLPFEKEAFRSFFTQMEAQSFPAVHHSTTYRTAYHPAYRVIVHEFLTHG